MLLGERRTSEALAEIEPLERATDPDPDHAYAVAQVLFAAREFERAATAIATATSANPDRPAFLSLEASIALARGDTGIALDRAERALALAPYNGYHHQTYATVLLNGHAAAEARRHLDATLGEIDDAGVLWYLSSIAKESTGDRIGAIEAILQALLVDPSDVNFRARASALWQV
jgi:predicted Zn-dependent protease